MGNGMLKKRIVIMGSLILSVMFLLFISYVVTDKRNLEHFCSSINSGMDVNDFHRLAINFGIPDNKLVGHEKDGVWSIYLPSKAIGVVCAVKHDRNKVLSSEMQYD